MFRAAYIYIITPIVKVKNVDTLLHHFSTSVFLTRQQIPFQLKPILSVKGFIFVTIDNTGCISHSHSNSVCKSSSPFSKMLVGSQIHNLKWQLLVSTRLLEAWAVLYKQIDKWRPQARLEMFVYKCPLLQLPGGIQPPSSPSCFPRTNPLLFQCPLLCSMLYSSYSAVLVHRFDWTCSGWRQSAAKVLWELSLFLPSIVRSNICSGSNLFAGSSLSALISVLSFPLMARISISETPLASVPSESTLLNWLVVPNMFSPNHTYQTLIIYYIWWLMPTNWNVFMSGTKVSLYQYSGENWNS